jgi:hypothetical protein
MSEGSVIIVEIPNSKKQITNKFQKQKNKSQTQLSKTHQVCKSTFANLFENCNFEIGIYLLFVF